jgi:hypothetical protein
MKTNILVSIVFVITAIVLGFLSYKKVLGDGWLDRADKVASITSLAIAIIAFANPFGGQATASRRQNMTVGDSNGSNIVQSGDNSQVTIGDTTTTAQKRSVDALERVKTELLDNFNNLALQIRTLEQQPPESFWDVRRPNETELAYQDRAKNEFRDYERFIQSLNNQLKFSGNLTATFQKDLAFDPKVAKRATQTYEQQQETRDSFASLESGLQHLVSLNLADGERTAQSKALHLEKVANAKMLLADAASYFCLIADADDIGLMLDSFSTMGIDVQLKPGDSGYKTAKRLATKFARERADVLRASLSVQSTAGQREIDRRINDPYLLMLRKATGLPTTLTEAEVNSLKNRKINQDETDPAELFKLAAFSYLESDGRAATVYFKRALATGELSARQAQYAQASIDRLENPDQYGESLGVMIIDLSAGGSFEQAGLKVGDVIVALEKEVANEPMDIASALAKAGTVKIPLTIVRNGQKQIVTVQGDQPAAAKLTQLIVLNAIQL